MALYNLAGLPRGPLLDGRRTEEVLRKKLAVLLAATMMVVMAVSPAWAAPGGNLKGNGDGQGAGDTINTKDTSSGGAQKTRVGGGPLNNPNVCDGCTPA
jgi:hypothetical protein